MCQWQAERSLGIDEDDLTTLVTLNIGIGQLRRRDEHLHLVPGAVGVTMIDSELTEQREGSRAKSNAGFFLEFTIGGLFEFLARLHMTTRESPLLRVDARMFIALLQQDASGLVDQDHPREPVYVGAHSRQPTRRSHARNIATSTNCFLQQADAASYLHQAGVFELEGLHRSFDDLAGHDILQFTSNLTESTPSG